MKKSQTNLFAVVIVIIVFFMSFTFTENEIKTAPNAGGKFEIPADIQEIFDNSCFGCHNSDSRNDKAKKKLKIDKLTDLSKAKLVGKLDGIAEVVKENEMPPEKFLEKYPENKLTEEDAKKLKKWAENTAENLMK